MPGDLSAGERLFIGATLAALGVLWLLAVVRARQARRHRLPMGGFAQAMATDLRQPVLALAVFLYGTLVFALAVTDLL